MVKTMMTPVAGRHFRVLPDRRPSSPVMITNPSDDVREGGAALFREKRTPKFPGAVGDRGRRF